MNVLILIATYSISFTIASFIFSLQEFMMENSPQNLLINTIQSTKLLGMLNSTGALLDSEITDQINYLTEKSCILSEFLYNKESP